MARTVLFSILKNSHDAMAFHACQIGLDQMLCHFLGDSRGHPNLL